MAHDRRPDADRVCDMWHMIGDQQVDLHHVRRLMDSNTVAIVGSAPQYPHGTVDDIEGLAKLAKV